MILADQLATSELSFMDKTLYRGRRKLCDRILEWDELKQDGIAWDDTKQDVMGWHGMLRECSFLSLSVGCHLTRCSDVSQLQSNSFCLVCFRIRLFVFHNDDYYIQYTSFSNLFYAQFMLQTFNNNLLNCDYL